MKKELSVKSVVAIGIGSAIFVILGRFARSLPAFLILVLKQLIPS